MTKLRLATRHTHLLESAVGVGLGEDVGEAVKRDVDGRGDGAVLDLLGVTDVDDRHVLRSARVVRGEK